MKIYTAHLPPAGDHMPVLIKEGVCWPAFIFTFVWALVKGEWLLALLIFASMLVIERLVTVLALPPAADLVLGLGLAAAVGIIANDWRRRRLARRGWRDLGPVAADSREAALMRVLAAGADRLPA